LKSIPGIGGYLASVILAECGDLRRFNNEDSLVLIGLVPGMYNGGESEVFGNHTEVSIAKLFS
jgi:transposase